MAIRPCTGEWPFALVRANGHSPLLLKILNELPECFAPTGMLRPKVVE
ncbi:hypothetical protein [Planktothricoides raciborskii]|uniref:Uncharacterized protein n=1 Tax=Planktothricoides raciborskii FACHB-1370 TaxID=2949576 RepID=A0ABR8EDI4_9CYAN|nr:hypothetical protein [Planktothricoides raciborskii]MBD2543661.1 hypothetical protein [Planktothricoides raciborskii FACHB-1370]MBD2582447.1 hypothetical protein [Planktothricoides raciborskii FACHB-1261]